MKTHIRMDEIPFVPVAHLEPMAQLGDTAPPREPPPAPRPTVPYVKPRVIAWRHDGGLDDTAHATLELAQAAARALHWAIYWKCAIQCGRDMIERRLIETPEG